ncbi:MAG TPA: ATP-binding protein [Kiritimatiellia bacterium]|nr:ATP-binding protein [Kiritimatiellia bacterium]
MTAKRIARWLAFVRPWVGMPGLKSRAWIIAVTYTVFAVLWIYYSDRTLAFLVRDSDTLIRWSIYKGIAYVIITALLLLLLMQRAFGALESGYTALTILTGKLQQHEKELEMLVSKRTAELQEALTRAESADRLKSSFLATMSHELRTPLNSIIGFTGVILQGLAGPLTPEQTKQLGMVQRSARHLLELINDVLDLSKIEAGQLSIRADAVDLPASIHHVVDLIRPDAEKKGLSLQLHMPDELPTIIGDRRRVEQILMNLLSNAVKFTEQGGVTLTVECVTDFRARENATDEAAIRFRVSDTGIGIHKQDLNTLFKPFSQIDTGLTRKHEGTGLGLAICRRLTDLMGGEIYVRSEPSRGSEFVVQLPLTMRPLE